MQLPRAAAQISKGGSDAHGAVVDHQGAGPACRGEAALKGAEHGAVAADVVDDGGADGAGRGAGDEAVDGEVDFVDERFHD